MLVNEIRRRFLGTAQYEKTRSITAPYFAVPYLRRNLRRVLDIQQYDLLLERGHDPSGHIGESSNDEHSTIWEFPSAAMLDGIIKGLEPTIRIDKLILRRQGSAKVKAPCHRTRSGRAGSPDWLPSEDEWRIPCQVSLKLTYQTEPKRTIHSVTKNGHVIRHDHPTKKPSFEITLDSPFEVPLGNLKVMVEYKDSKGKIRWKLARDDSKFSVQFRVQCNDFTSSTELLSQLEGHEISTYADMHSNEGELKIRWNGLPDLPASGELLDLRRLQNKKLVKLDYEAEVNMVWNQECQPLAAWNRAWQLQQQEDPRQLPTPSISDDSERPRKMRVQYLTQLSAYVQKSVAAKGLHCIVSSCHERAEHSSLERLMLHYALHHDHLQVEISPDRSDDNLAVIFVSRAEDESSSPSSQNQEFEWQAPDSAFDIAAHLKGTKPWAVTHSKEKSAKKTPQKSPKKRAQGGQTDHIPIFLGRTRTTIRNPEDVLDLPEVPRKRHRVPEVENISFYRTLSKQRVPAGEEVSDSEEEADMTWSIQCQRREQTVMGIDPATQDFNELLNQHLELEQPMSDMFTQDAIVRFARKYATRLVEQKWNELFQAKLKQFESKGIINSGTVAYCLGLLTTVTGQPTVESGRDNTPSRRSVSQALSGKGRFIRRDRGSETRTPERAKAMSPPSHLSTKSRLRWQDGFPTPVPASARRQAMPFGRRRIICRRGNKPSKPYYMFDFARDDQRDTPRDDIQPKDLELAKLLRVLTDESPLDSDVDIIVCVNDRTTALIMNEDDWLSALKNVQSSNTVGDIVFELRPRREMKDAPNSTTKRKRVDDNNDGPSRKNARIEKDHLCVCGEEAGGRRGTMACGNHKCSRQFHVRCLCLQQRPVGEWLCADCR